MFAHLVEEDLVLCTDWDVDALAIPLSVKRMVPGAAFDLFAPGSPKHSLHVNIYHVN